MRRHIHTHTESLGLLTYLGWMRLWLACTVENITARGFRYLRMVEAKALQEAADITSGKTRAPALIPDAARAPEAPKIMLSRSSKRMLARGLPASRRYAWFRYASPRTLNGNQFFELLGRISVHGRASVYRLEYKRRLCVRRPYNVVTVVRPRLVNPASVSLGYCAAHLWPN